MGPDSTIYGTNTSSLIFSGTTPTLKGNLHCDSFFTSRDSVQLAANTQLLQAGVFAPTKIGGDTISFDATTTGVSVFNWNIDQLTSINEVGFNFSGTDSFIVVNIFANTPAEHGTRRLTFSKALTIWPNTLSGILVSRQ